MYRCGRNNSHILKGNKNQTKQGTQKILLFIKSTYDAFFSNTFKANIAQVAAVIDDTILKPCRDHRFIVLEKRFNNETTLLARPTHGII
jgi:hypothetical protein